MAEKRIKMDADEYRKYLCSGCGKTAINCKCDKTPTGDIVGKDSSDILEVETIEGINSYEDAVKAYNEIAAMVHGPNSLILSLFLKVSSGGWLRVPFLRNRAEKLVGATKAGDLSRIRRFSQRLSNMVLFLDRGKGS